MCLISDGLAPVPLVLVCVWVLCMRVCVSCGLRVDLDYGVTIVLYVSVLVCGITKAQLRNSVRDLRWVFVTLWRWVSVFVCLFGTVT